MRAVLIALVFLLASTVLVTGAGAVEPDEILADPALEARARTISKRLRCLVCQNQSIDDSNAQLARDLRILVRRRLTAGDSDADAVAYIVARYGDFVLLRPPLKLSTLALWFGPAAILALAAGGLVFWYRRRTIPEPAVALSALERARLNKRLARKAEE